MSKKKDEVDWETTDEDACAVPVDLKNWAAVDVFASTFVFDMVILKEEEPDRKNIEIF